MAGKLSGNRGLAFRLCLWILSCTLVVLALLSINNDRVARRIILENVEQRARSLAQATANRIEAKLVAVQKVAENVASGLQDASMPGVEIIDLGRRIVMNNPEIYGSAIAFEPFAQDPYELYFAPYHFKSHGRVAYTNLGGSDYRYFYLDWYQLPKELGRGIWTEPYFDEGGGNTLMCTYAVPFHQKDAEGEDHFAGVVTADIDLKELRKVVDSIKVFDTGFAFLISRNGTFVTHPDPDMVLNETIFSVAEAYDDQQARDIGKAMLAGETGMARLRAPALRADSLLYYAPLPSSGWSLGVIFPEAEFMADADTLSHTMWFIGALGFCALFLLVVAIARSITRPLGDLADSAMEIAGGNLDAEVPARESRDEVGELAEAFAHMQVSLKQHIAELGETMAAKGRMESELKIARDIQMGILPKLFPAFPERSEFDIFASIEPAREVGGDLYDFFFLDEKHFCFLIGDVSDKGVPAAFFMAVTKTLLKVVAERDPDPGAILTKVNNDLAEENDSCMFVTLFVAVLDLATGEVRYASAGHNPPIVLRNEGEPEWVPVLHDPVAGAMEDIDYQTAGITLAPGETLLLYTDGVTEAMDKDKNIYSDPRLMELAATLKGKSAEEIIRAVDDSIKAFTGGAAQSDDITALALQYTCAWCPGADTEDADAD